MMLFLFFGIDFAFVNSLALNFYLYVKIFYIHFHFMTFDSCVYISKQAVSGLLIALVCRMVDI